MLERITQALKGKKNPQVMESVVEELKQCAEVLNGTFGGESRASVLMQALEGK